MMVVPRLIGRLGNQAFQIAAAVGYSVKYNVPYRIPIYTAAPNVWENYFSNLATVDDRNLGHAIVLREKGHDYTELPFINTDRPVVLDGYFQSEKYFKHCYKLIRDLFFPGWSRRYNNVIGVHVRRGDYLLYPTKHNTPSKDYIIHALVKISEMKPDTDWLVRFYSDDIDWCKEQFGDNNFSVLDNISFSEGLSPMEDLQDLACCNHIVGSASSFSLWAYYLNRRVDKIGIFPKEWFGEDNKHLSTADIYPENCIKL